MLTWKQWPGKVGSAGTGAEEYSGPKELPLSTILGLSARHRQSLRCGKFKVSLLRVLRPQLHLGFPMLLPRLCLRLVGLGGRGSHQIGLAQRLPGSRFNISL